jgi:hypothetical protein
MGTLYLAERVDGEVSQRAAVKLLAPGAGEIQRERFLQERQILASLHVTIRAASLDSPASRIIGEADSGAIVARGHLLYVRDKKLFAQPFDAGHLLTTGDSVPLAGQMAAGGSSSGNFSASEHGSLVYVAGGAASYELVWFDRSGKRLSTLGEKLSPFSFVSPPSLSPDGKWIAADQIEMNNSDIWFYDAVKGLRTRCTFDPAQEVCADYETCANFRAAAPPAAGVLHD